MSKQQYQESLNSQNTKQLNEDDLDILNFEDPGNSLSSSVQSSQLSKFVDKWGNPKSPPPNESQELPQSRTPSVVDEDRALTEELIEKKLSNLGKTAHGNSFTYLDIHLSGQMLVSIDPLYQYEHLQNVDISYNKLRDISCLQHLTSLVRLNASHNLLSEAIPVEFPATVTYLNLSFNQFTKIPDLSRNYYLKRLHLDHNSIASMEGLEVLPQLLHLNLDHNAIRQISHINGLPLQYVSVMYNNLSAIENIDHLSVLQEIYLGGNRIRSLAGLENHDALHTIGVEENRVVDLDELKYLKTLHILRNLDLRGNPLQDMSDYRLAVIFELTRLTVMDNKMVTIQEKVRAENQFHPSDEILAERDHRINIVYNFFQPHDVLDSTLNSADSPYPMLVLVGPSGSGKKDLAFRLSHDFPEFFGYAASHTTRPASVEEENGREYFFVREEEFEELHMKGKFLQTAMVDGHLYGLSIDSIEAVARDGLACVACMGLEGVLSLKRTPLEPRYVLLMPQDPLQHEQRLREKPIIPQLESRLEKSIQGAMAQVLRYAKHHLHHPGFFDMFIASDDLVDAYFQLRRLVLGYLGLTEKDASGSHSNVLSPLSTTRPTEGGEGVSAATPSWSKNSQRTSGSQKNTSSSYMFRASHSTSARGKIEEESFNMRRQASREVVSGKQLTQSSSAGLSGGPPSNSVVKTLRQSVKSS